ncbi:hypothetical protein ABIF65_009535 [Bradyrhizobium japonicum]
MKSLLLGTSLLVAFTPSAFAESIFVDRGAIVSRDVSESDVVAPPEVPKEIADAIKAAPKIRNVIPITNSETFTQQVIKADEIVFDKNSHLVLANFSYPWVAIAAKNLKFRDASAYSFIERDMSVRAGTDGRQGSPGLRGPDDYGETNRRGNDGHPGQPGGLGGSGGFITLPTIYIIAEKLLDDKNKEIPPGILNLAVLVRGVDGGAGGPGGRGGDGGHAGNGKEGASGAFDCHEGPGPGGNGGAAGPGGHGGNGGNGGAGATIVFVSLKRGADTFSYSRVNNQGGLGGLGGRGGSPGTPGGGGGGAGRNGWCGPSGPGSPGDYPNPANLGIGSPGSEGGKGEMFVVAVKNLDPYF